MESYTELEVCENLKKLYDESENRVKSDAMVCRAYVDRISTDTINEKVDAQMKSVQVSISDINPKFKETSKNYEQIKELVSEVLSNYKQALIELGEFYDGKIEQLILRKVELESSLVGSLINEDYLYRKVNKRTGQKENDKVKNSIKENVKSVLEKIKIKKKENVPIDTNMIFDLLDGQDVADEFDKKNTKNLENAINSKEKNKDEIERIEKEIALVTAEIQRLNEQKKKAIYDAMESGGKSITKNIRRPKVFSKLTRFFVSRFNTAKVVESTIIDPLKLRIESFRNNELNSMKG